jgi:hypothetical protein
MASLYGSLPALALSRLASLSRQAAHSMGRALDILEMPGISRLREK